MSRNSNSHWFNLIAETVKDLVEDHSGAFVMTREELRDELVVMCPELRDCPSKVMNHMTMAFPNVSVSSKDYVPGAKGPILVWRASWQESRARNFVQRKGESFGTRIAVANA